MNDYREVQSYLSHGLFDKKKKQYYKTEAITAPKIPVGTVLTPRDRVEESLKSGKMSLDQIYRGAYSNRASGKAVYQRKVYGMPLFPVKETEEDYKKRIKKYAVDVGQARNNFVKSFNSELQAKKDIERAKVRVRFTKPVRESANALVGLYEQRNNIVSDLGKASSSLNYQAKQQLLKKKEKLDSDIEKKADELKGYLWDVKDRSDNKSITDDERKAVSDILDSSKALGIIGELQAKKAAQLFHSGLEEYIAHGYEAAMHNKRQSQESVKRQGEVNQTVQSLKDAAIRDITFFIKDYDRVIERERQKIVKAKNMLNSPAGTQAKSSYVRTNSGESSIREEIKVIEYWMNKDIEAKEELENKLQEIKSDKTGKKAKAWVDSHKNALHHSSLEEDNMSNEYTEINAYLQHGLFDIFKSKPKYNSTGSAAGMPSNIHLGDSYNPTARASAIQDEIVRMSKKLAEYENGEVKAKADYDRYKKLVKETKAKLSDLEKARANAVTQSVNSNTKRTTVTSSAPNKTKLIRTNPIFDRDVANLRNRR